MEITIGVQHIARELTLDVESSAKDIIKKVNDGVKNGGIVEFTDSRGRAVVVPVSAIGYVEIGPEETRRVGFGSL